MDYVVGSVAALISGNVTPNRPKVVKRALTPIKHPPSPNVTPKSQVVDDRSIFLSPTIQKKKAIVKKSPKRIFQSPDLDVTNGSDESNINTPKVNKVKKYLENDLDCNISQSIGQESKGINSISTRKLKTKNLSLIEDMSHSVKTIEVPKKKKKSKFQVADDFHNDDLENRSLSDNFQEKITNKKVKKEQKLTVDTDSQINTVVTTDSTAALDVGKKRKKQKKKKSKIGNEFIPETESNLNEVNKTQSKKKKKDKTFINPNAITSKDSDSEHESDHDIESETEMINKKIMDVEPAEESSDEEEKEVQKKDKKDQPEINRVEELNRTLFVGNVPFSPKCKKEIKKIFGKYGDIESVRIRTVPVRDARTTPKLAVIKNEFHPERSTVNVYVKFREVSSVQQALVENNSLLNGYHLRVSRSDSTGQDHDLRCSIFVGNLPFALEDDAFREKFEKCGEIESVRIIRDRKTNAGKGFGYVNFKSKDGVELALALKDEDLTIKNRILRVKRCTQVNNKHGFNNKQDINKNHGKFGKNESGRDFTGRYFGQNKETQDGAFRRLAHKRKNLDNTPVGPPNKVERNQYLNQPQREKKVRKEFVGMTAEKKKRNKVNKGQKKKKQLSEILTK